MASTSHNLTYIFIIWSNPQDQTELEEDSEFSAYHIVLLGTSMLESFEWALLMVQTEVRWHCGGLGN